MVVQNKLDVYHVGKQLDNEGDRIMEYAKSQGIVGMYACMCLWDN